LLPLLYIYFYKRKEVKKEKERERERVSGREGESTWWGGELVPDKCRG